MNNDKICIAGAGSPDEKIDEFHLQKYTFRVKSKQFIDSADYFVEIINSILFH